MNNGPIVEGPCVGRHKNCFTKFTNGGVVASVGDIVCVVNDKVEDSLALESCRIGTLMEIYREDYKHGRVDWHAVVQWYRRPIELPPRANCDALDPAIDVIKDGGAKMSIIELDEIFSVCKVVDAYTDDVPHAKVQQEKARGVENPVFVCRFALNVNRRAPKTFALVPVIPVPLPSRGKTLKKKKKISKVTYPTKGKDAADKIKARENAVKSAKRRTLSNMPPKVVSSPPVNLKYDTSGCISNMDDVMEAIEAAAVSDDEAPKTFKRKSAAKSQSNPQVKVLGEKPFNKVGGFTPIQKVSAQTSELEMTTEDLRRVLEDDNDSTKENGTVSNDSPLKRNAAANLASPPLSPLSPCQMYGSATKSATRSAAKHFQELHISTPVKTSVRRRLDSSLVSNEQSTKDHPPSDEDEVDAEIAKAMSDQQESSKVQNGGKISSRRKSAKGEVDDRPVSKASWVSELLDLNEPINEDGGRCVTPIRLSLRRIRLDSPPLQDTDDEPVDLNRTSRRKSQVKKPSTPSVRSMTGKSATEDTCDTDDSTSRTPQNKFSHITRRKKHKVENDSDQGSLHGPSEMTNRSLRAKKRQNVGNESMEEDDDSDFMPLTPSKSKKTPNPLTNAEVSPLKSSTPLASRIQAPGTRKTPGRTPSKTPVKARRSVAPSMPTRTSLAPVPVTSLEKARANLQVSAVPTSLPCRETEFENIYCFVEGKIRDRAGGCMYVSGMPGTGKTATVHAVVRSLREQVKAGNLPDFQYVEVNGLRLTEPRQVYVQILYQLTNQKCAAQQAQDILASRFSSGKKNNKIVFLLVDEVDMLRNRRQDVVYNLFDWPSKPHSRFIVLTIANTMDLPEKLLMSRVTSRLGLTRLTFQPYTHKQLQEIVSSRLEGTGSFNPDAVQLVSRKVAAVSGDARRALDICRRATELVKEGSQVTMAVIDQALGQMMNSASVKAIKACSKLEKLFLQAVVAENQRTGVEETSFVAVYRQFQSLCAFSSVPLLNTSEALLLLNRLGSSRILLTGHSRGDINQSVCLNVSSDDIHYALNQPAPTPA